MTPPHIDVCHRRYDLMENTILVDCLIDIMCHLLLFVLGKQGICMAKSFLAAVEWPVVVLNRKATGA